MADVGNSTITLERVVDEARSLTVVEQQQLRDTVDGWLAEATAQERERAVLRMLVERGLIAKVKPLHPADREPFEPIKVSGPSVSDAIIEDRG